MMNKLLVFITFFLVSTSSFAQNKGWTEDNIKGEVKSFTQTEYEIIERYGKTEIGRKHSEVSKRFDKRGNLIFEFKEEEELGEVKMTYKYDEHGNQIEVNEIDGYSDIKYINKFDGRGKKVEQNTYGSDGSFWNKRIFKYNVNGNQIEQNIYNSSGNLVYRSSYKYDEHGNRIVSNTYNPDGSLYFKVTCKYDESGNQVERNTYEPEYNIKRKWTYDYEYDDKGNWIKRSDYLLLGILGNKLENLVERKYVYYDEIPPIILEEDFENIEDKDLKPAPCTDDCYEEFGTAEPCVNLKPNDNDCPEASTVPCGDEVINSSDCHYCFVIGKGPNPATAPDPATVPCGEQVVDACGNDVEGVFGTMCSVGICQVGRCFDDSGDGVFGRRVIYRNTAEVLSVGFDNQEGKIIVANICVTRAGKITSAEIIDDETSAIIPPGKTKDVLRGIYGYRVEADLKASKEECGKLSIVIKMISALHRGN